jgi:hypothetical protein
MGSRGLIRNPETVIDGLARFHGMWNPIIPDTLVASILRTLRISEFLAVTSDCEAMG